MTMAAPAPAPSPAASPAPPVRSPGLVERLMRDPNAIWMREMRQAARLGRTPWVLFSLTLTLSLLMCSIGGLAAASHTTPASIGGVLFQVFFSLAYLVVVAVGPAVAANAVASEREGKTWEAVLLTGLRPQDIARGKFMAAYTTIALYIVALAPVGALSFLFGGVTATEVVVAFVFLFLVAGLAVAFGLAVSSLMSSLRGAIVVTVMLAIAIGPTLYFLLGFTASLGIHKIWSEVPEAYPIWLPLAYSRGKMGLEYLLILVGLPLLAIIVPAWFLYETTVSNLCGDADDRSTGLKRWFTFSTPLLAVASAVPTAVADDDGARLALSLLGLSGFSLYGAFCAFLFAADPPGPSRRVRIHWERSRAGALTRFYGPGLPRTAMLVTVLGFVSIWMIAVGDMTLCEWLDSAVTQRALDIQAIFFFAVYASGFYVFVVGLASWLRSRGQSAWVARLICGALLFLVSAGPWVVAAIGGLLSDHHGSDEWLVIGSPSPFYALVVVSWIHDNKMVSNVPVVEAGALCSLLWGLVGLALLGAAAHRCRRTMRDLDAAVEAAEDALRAEDNAAVAGAPPPAPAAAAASSS